MYADAIHIHMHTPYNYVVVVLKLCSFRLMLFITRYRSVCTPNLRSKNNFDEIKQKADSVCTHFNNCYIIARMCVRLQFILFMNF